MNVLNEFDQRSRTIRVVGEFRRGGLGGSRGLVEAAAANVIGRSAASRTGEAAWPYAD